MEKTEFYQQLDLRYPEIAILLEDTYGPLGKFYIPILTPLLDKDVPYNKKEYGINTRNIINDVSGLSIEGCTLSNYIDIKLPGETTDILISAGTKFVVIFIGGDINKPILIGRY